MTYKVCYWDSVQKCQKERDATEHEVAEIEARKANPETFVAAAPTKEELLAELQALTAKINALG